MKFALRKDPLPNMLIEVVSGPIHSDGHGKITRYDHMNVGAGSFGNPEGPMVWIEVQKDGYNTGAANNPDFRIPVDQVPNLILALQWMIAGDLGRRAIEQEHCSS